MKALKYNQINLIPNYSECFSRSDCDTSVDLCGKTFKLPIIPANMKSVISMKVARWMSDNDYFYIMHRFDNSLRDIVSQMNDENWKTISVSMGVKLCDKKDIVALSKHRQVIDYITIDVAHGHHERVKSAIDCVKRYMPTTKIIAGNVATAQAVKDLASWGADVVKVGIGQGSPCTTKDKTGFTMPMFTCTQICSNNFIDEDGEAIPIIADGGIQSNGDIAKGIVAGAKMVMAGGLFAACIDSPAASSIINGMPHKAYFGSASIENKGHKNHVEGKLNNICSNSMSYEDKLFEIEQDVQSAISYAGGSDLSCLSGDVDYVEVG